MTEIIVPSTGYLRLSQIIGDKRHNIPPIIPVSKSTWWLGVSKGIYPKSIKLGPRTTVWRVEDILRLIGGNDASNATAKPE